VRYAAYNFDEKTDCLLVKQKAGKKQRRLLQKKKPAKLLQ